MDLSDLLRCPLCFEDFDCDVAGLSTDEERRSSRLPVLSHQCPHKICASCLNNWQLVAISNQKSTKAKTPKWFKCHTCKEKTAFNAVDIKIDLYACGTVASIKSSGTTRVPNSRMAKAEATGETLPYETQQAKEKKEIPIKTEDSDNEKTPPLHGAPEVKQNASGRTFYWCAKCKVWTPSHSTVQHVNNKKKKNGGNPNKLAGPLAPLHGMPRPLYTPYY